MAVSRFYYRDPAAPAPTAPPSIGVVALIEREGALLLEQRSDCARWGLVGGSVEPGESLLEALRREVREETGLAITGFRLFGTFSDPSRVIAYPDGSIKRVITLVYHVDVPDFRPLRPSEESLDLRFVPRHDLPAMDIVETHAHIIAAYLAGAELVLE
jgi:8-oxo-dGTP pyrophosphatase MutT (NUDIX family)